MLIFESQSALMEQAAAWKAICIINKGLEEVKIGMTVNNQLTAIYALIDTEGWRSYYRVIMDELYKRTFLIYNYLSYYLYC